jgi:hypothetical protein
MAITFERPFERPMYTIARTVKLDGKVVGSIVQTQTAFYFYVPRGQVIDPGNPEFQMFSTLEACQTDVAGEKLGSESVSE